MKKILLAILLMIPLAASAYDFMVSGVAYKVISLSDLTCEVTSGCKPRNGKLKIPDEVIYEGRIFKVLGIGDGYVAEKETIKELVIENGPTYIGEKAFSTQIITSIEIPPSINVIREHAFVMNNGDFNKYGQWVGKPTELILVDGTTERLKFTSPYSVSTPFEECYIQTFYMGRPLSMSSLSTFSSRVENFAIGHQIRELYGGDVLGFSMRSLKQLEIGMRLRELPDLHEGDNLEYIAIFSMRPPVAHGFSEHTKMFTTLYVPVGAKKIYEKTNVWKEFWHIEESDLLTPCMPNIPDINQDDKIGIKDFTDLIDYMMGKKPENVTPVTADTNYDGKVNIADMVLLSNAYYTLLEAANK